jgi:hypothetical protein
MVVRADDHCNSVPTDERANAALALNIARKPGLRVDWDGVDVWRTDRLRTGQSEKLALIEQQGEQVTSASLPPMFNDCFQRINPFSSLRGVNVWKLLDELVIWHRHQATR